MEIKAVKTYENGFMTQAFAFGGRVENLMHQSNTDQAFRII